MKRWVVRSWTWSSWFTVFSGGWLGRIGDRFARDVELAGMNWRIYVQRVHGRVVKLADTQDLGSCAARLGGSSPSAPMPPRGGSLNGSWSRKELDNFSSITLEVLKPGPQCIGQVLVQQEDDVRRRIV